MRPYEIVYILDAGLERADVDAKLETFHAALDGEVTAVDHWGLRQLAYPIDKRTTAYYVVVQVEADPESLPEFERLLRLDEETVRYLLVVNEGQPTSGASVLADPVPGFTAAGEDEDLAGDSGEGDGEVSAEGDGSEAGLAAHHDVTAADGAEDRVALAEAAAADGEDSAAEATDADGNAPAAEASDDGDGETAGEDDGASDADPDEDAEAAPRSGPPEFSGARGRRRRHEGPPIVLLNYKDVTTLSRFLTEQGRILPKRTTKVTARFQRRLGVAVKRARYLALIPYMKDQGA